MTASSGSRSQAKALGVSSMSRIPPSRASTPGVPRRRAPEPLLIFTSKYVPWKFQSPTPGARGGGQGLARGTALPRRGAGGHPGPGPWPPHPPRSLETGPSTFRAASAHRSRRSRVLPAHSPRRESTHAAKDLRPVFAPLPRMPATPQHGTQRTQRAAHSCQGDTCRQEGYII